MFSFDSIAISATPEARRVTASPTPMVSSRATVSSWRPPSDAAQRSNTSFVATAVMLVNAETSVCMASHKKLARISPPSPAGN